MTVAHVALCEVGGVVLQELADVGQRLPVHHSRRLLGVTEGVRLVDGVRPVRNDRSSRGVWVSVGL